MTRTIIEDGLAAAVAPGADVPDIGFSAAELLYLLSVEPGAASDRSAEVFGVHPVPTDGDALLPGAAALLAHGMLDMVDEARFELRGAALIVSYILAHATRWSVIGGATDTGADLGVYVRCEDGALLAQPRALGTWWFVLLDAVAPADEIVLATATSFVDEAEATGVYVRESTLVSDLTFSIRRNASDWGFAWGTSESVAPRVLVEDTDRDASVAALAEFLRTLPPEAASS